MWCVAFSVASVAIALAFALAAILVAAAFTFGHVDAQHLLDPLHDLIAVGHADIHSATNGGQDGKDL